LNLFEKKYLKTIEEGYLAAAANKGIKTALLGSAVGGAIAAFRNENFLGHNEDVPTIALVTGGISGVLGALRGAADYSIEKDMNRKQPR